MKLKLKSDSGLVREVPTGLSFTGLFFTGFVMLFRGMFTRGIVYLLLVYGYQFATWMAAIVILITEGEQVASEAVMTYTIIGLIPNIIFLFKLNKWTARYWLDRGYKPIGEGWDVWGPKYGLHTGE
jgi:hypothetical protein